MRNYHRAGFDLVAAASLQQQVKNDANTAIDLTVAALKTAILLMPASSATPACGASAAAPASAPAAASGTLVAAVLK